MKLLLTTLVFFFIGFITVKATLNICIPYKSVDVKDTEELLEDVNQFTAKLQDAIPFPIEHVDVKNITHPAFTLNGTLDNVLVYNLNEYNLCLLDWTPEHLNLFNLTFMNITVRGDYNLTGDIGNLFEIFGDGEFWINLTNLSIAMNNFSINTTESDNCFQINIDLDFAPIRLHFYHSMGDKEVEDIISKALSSILPESLRIIWSELKGIFDEPIEDAINNFFHRTNVVNILNKLHQISSSLPNSFLPLCFGNTNSPPTTTVDPNTPFVKLI